MKRDLDTPALNAAAVALIPPIAGGTGATSQIAACVALHALPNGLRDVPNGFVGLDASALIPKARVPFPPATVPTVNGPLTLEKETAGIYTITNYDINTLYALHAVSGTVTRTGATITYTAPSYPGASGFTLNTILFPVTVIGVGVVQPLITQPIANATNQLFELTARSTAFSESTNTDTHLSSSWQLATDASFTAVVATVDGSAVYKTTWPLVNLAVNTTYYLRVRHTGAALGHSEWSVPAVFSTKPVRYACTETAKVLPTAKSNSQLFGDVLALSSDGKTCVVAADRALVSSPNLSGAVYVYEFGETGWSRTYAWLSPGYLNEEEFGTHVDISGDGNTIVVSAPRLDLVAHDAGAVHVYIRSGATWVEQQRFGSTDPGIDDYFGYSVSLSENGNTLAVGAVYDDNARGVNAGAVYIFTRTNGVWTQKAKLLASDGVANLQFGRRVDLCQSGETLAVTSIYSTVAGKVQAGALYVYQLTNATWVQQAKLVASDPEANAWFGHTAAFSSDGNTLITGCKNDDTTNGVNSGSAYIFTRTGVTWTQQAKLIASDGGANDLFGNIVVMSHDGGLVFIGALYNSTQYGTRAGSVYVFEKDGTNWIQRAVIYATDGATDDYFGRTIDINHDGSKLIVASSQDDNESGVNAGSFYYFT